MPDGKPRKDEQPKVAQEMQGPSKLRQGSDHGEQGSIAAAAVTASSNSEEGERKESEDASNHFDYRRLVENDTQWEGQCNTPMQRFVV